MADATWFNYVAAATGVYGAVMGHIAFRRSVKDRTQELRLRLRREINELRATAAGLPALLNLAHDSRTHVLAAQKLSGSGNMQIWRNECDADVARVAQLVLPEADAEYSDLSAAQLETHLVQLHALALEVGQLSAKCQATIAADDLIRAESRDNQNRRALVCGAGAATAHGLGPWAPPAGAPPRRVRLRGSRCPSC